MSAELRPAASLRAQVTRAEQRVMHRRRVIGLRASRLRLTFSEKIRNPAILVWAAGAGFLAGELLQHRKVSADSSDSPEPAGRSLLGRAMQWSSIATSIAAAFGAIHGDNAD